MLLFLQSFSFLSSLSFSFLITHTPILRQLKQAAMDGRRGENPLCCCFHPAEFVVGVCALCLRERLVILAAEQEKVLTWKDRSRRRSSLKNLSATSSVIPKAFSLTSFLHRRRFRSSDEVDSIPSVDDSFISIKFEDDGKASWDKKANVATQSHSSRSGSGARQNLDDQSVVVDRRTGLRWKKRVGYLFFQVLRLRRSSKQSSSSHAPTDVSDKGRKGWIRRLTARNPSTVKL